MMKVSSVELIEKQLAELLLLVKELKKEDSVCVHVGDIIVPTEETRDRYSLRQEVYTVHDVYNNLAIIVTNKDRGVSLRKDQYAVLSRTENLPRIRTVSSDEYAAAPRKQHFSMTKDLTLRELTNLLMSRKGVTRLPLNTTWVARDGTHITPEHYALFAVPKQDLT